MDPYETNTKTAEQQNQENSLAVNFVCVRRVEVTDIRACPSLSSISFGSFEHKCSQSG